MYTSEKRGKLHAILRACKPGLYSPQSSKREQNGGHKNELSSVFDSLIVCREFPCPLFLLQEKGYRTAYHETYTILTSKASCSSSKQKNGKFLVGSSGERDNGEGLLQNAGYTTKR